MKSVLITGATKGIGKSIAEVMVSEGYHVILNYANDDITAKTFYNLLNEQFPDKVSLLKENLSNIDSIEPFFNKVKEITTKLDVIIFNIGKTDRSKLNDITYENWKSVFDANLTVPFFMIQKFLPLLVQNSSILFTGSSMGVYPHSLSISYGVSKAAVHALVKNLVKFLSPMKIRINAVVPGFVDTEWQATKAPEIRANIESKISLNRFCSPFEIAQAFLFLINNNYMNGELLTIDGGYCFQ